MIPLEVGDVLGLAAAVGASVETGLLAALAKPGGVGPAEAARLGLDAAAVARVLDVLVAARVAVEAGGVYTLAPDLAALHRAFPGGLTLTALLYAGTPALLRTGAPAFEMDGGTAERAEAYRKTVAGLAALFQHAAPAFAARLAPELAVGARIVDVGCGSGVWGLALAAAVEGATVVGVDLAPVLDVFRETAAARGLAGRVSTVAGDMHEAPLPPADVVLLANVLRLEPADRAAALLRRLAASVAPGGRLVVVDALAEGSPDRDVARTTYALHLALRTRRATVHAPAQVRAWCAEAGLVRVRSVDFGVWPGAVAAVVAEAAG